MNRQNDLEYFATHQGPIPGSITIEAKQEGPHLLIVGGTHGNEPSGVLAIIRFHQFLLENPQFHFRGKISFLLANPEAYLQNKRYIDYDLNRSFDTKFPPKGHEAKRAAEIKSFLSQIAPIDRVLDIHSVSKDDSQIMVYNVNQPHSRELALAISGIDIHFAFHPHHIDGLLIDECSRNGATTSLAVECGNHYDPKSEDVAFFHIYRFLNYYGLTKSNPVWEGQEKSFKKVQTLTHYETIDSIRISPGFNFVNQKVETGEFVPKGTAYAKSDNGDYLAEKDCYIVMPPSKVDPTDYDAGFICSRELIEVSHS